MTEAIKETKELKRKLTKQEKYELKIQQGKKLLAEIQTEREEIGALFFLGSIKSGDIDINNIDDLLARNLTKDKDRKIYRDYFDRVFQDLARKNNKKIKADEPAIIEETADEPTITDETAKYQSPNYGDMYKALREVDYARN